MKRIVMAVIVLLTAVSLFAGGKECDLKKNAKSVELTGTLVRSGDGDQARTVFRVANQDRSYTVCHETKSDVLKLGDAGAKLQVTGKVVSCGEGDGEELVILTAKKI